MPDNRITIRFNPEQLRGIETFRSRLFMDRQEFVRYCVSETLRELFKRDTEYNKEIERLRSENSELKKWILDNH